MSQKQKIIIYTDGGARGNGKVDSLGGWSAVLIYGNRTKEIYGNAKGVTNNQMELMGAIKSLQALKTTNIPIELHCDSAYVVNGMNQWVNGWIKNGWKTKDKKPVKNKELWQELVKLCGKQDDVNFFKTKGHSGIELNERADELVNIAMDNWEG